MSGITSIREHIVAVREEARTRAEVGKADEAEVLLRQTLEELIRNRKVFVNWRRGIGAVLGGLAGWLLTIALPGGTELTLLGSVFGSSVVGERMGRYTGERLSEEEYRQALVALHQDILGLWPEPDLAVFGRTRKLWRGLIVLQTPLDLLTPFTEKRQSWWGNTLTALKSFVGVDPYRMAVENASPSYEAWDSLMKLVGHINRLGAYGREGRYLATHLYRAGCAEASLLTLCNYYTYLDMVNYPALKQRHRERYGEELLVMLRRIWAQNPEDERAIASLAQGYLEEEIYEDESLPVYLAAFATLRDPLPVAAAICLCHDFGPALDGHQDVLLQLIENETRVREQGLLGETECLDVLELRGRRIVSDRLRDEGSLAILQRLYASRPSRPVILWLARLYLEEDVRDERREIVLRTAYDKLGVETIPAEAHGWPAVTLRRLVEALAPTTPAPDDPSPLLREGAVAMETGDWGAAVEAFQRLKGDYNLHRNLSAEKKLFLSHQLGRAYRHLGEGHRALEYFKSVALVVPSDVLLEDIFSFARETQRRGEKPSLARNAFLLVKSCKADYVSSEGRGIDAYLDTLKNVFDHYLPDSIRKIGGGGMAVLFSGVHRESRQTHVIKQLRTDFGTEKDMEQFRKLFSSEIKAIKRLNESDHPGSKHIVVLHHESADENSFSYSMEALEEILSDRLRDRGRLTEEETLELLRGLCSGLACAHAEGVIHRDLNPRNVGFKDGMLKIFDFGTAHVLRTTLHLVPHPGIGGYQREDNLILGTPRYMSPEQAAGKAFDERTDIFSLGCVAFECLAGEMAFPGQVGSQILLFDPSYPAELSRRLRRFAGPLIADTILECLEGDPTRRPSTMPHVLELLGKA